MGAYARLHRRVEVLGGCDSDPDRREKFKRRWNIEFTDGNPDRVLEIVKPDLVSICTWTDSHHLLVHKALEHPSVKAIICEKPLALDSRKAAAMVKACGRKGVHLLTNHERRFEDRYMAIRQWIKEGRIGKLRTIVGHVLTTVPLRQKSFDINKSSLLHDGTHLIDIIHFLAGPTREVSGNIASACQESVTATMTLDSGVRVFLEAGGLRNYFDFELDLQGSEGRILISNKELRYFSSQKSRLYTGFRDLVERRIPFYKKNSCFLELVSHALDLMEGTAQQNISSGLDGLEVLKVIEAISSSAARQGKLLKI
jgi:predicted dehydrogenase